MDETKANMSVGTGDFTYSSFERNHHPFFYGHGIVALLSDRIVPGNLKTMPDKDLFVVHGQGMHEGRPCLVLRTHPIGSGSFEEFWVDTARDSAIIRRTSFRKGGQVHTDCHVKYQRTSHGWLPHQWTFTLRDTRRGATMYEERLRLDELKLDVTVRNEDFDVDVPAGTLNQQTRFSKPASKTILERPKMESTLHKLREDGKWEEVIIEGDEIKKRWPLSAWWALGLVPIGFVSLALVYKRKVRQ